MTTPRLEEVIIGATELVIPGKGRCPRCGRGTRSPETSLHRAGEYAPIDFSHVPAVPNGTRFTVFNGCTWCDINYPLSALSVVADLGRVLA